MLPHYFPVTKVSQQRLYSPLGDATIGQMVVPLAPSESVLADFSLIETKVTLLLPLHFSLSPPFLSFYLLIFSGYWIPL